MSIADIKKRWDRVISEVQKKALDIGRNPDDIKVVAVSKTHLAETMIDAINAGVYCIGENYVQELIAKHPVVSSTVTNPVEWHFIGHLQSNKVKFITSFIDMIHSCDSINLAREISKEAIKVNRTIEVLLQVNTSGELSKSGCQPESVFKLYEESREIENIKVTGLMTIGSFTGIESIIRKEFTILRNLREEINSKYSVNLKHLSMGMTGDYPVAIEEGSTLLRIGTAIFGERDYSLDD